MIRRIAGPSPRRVRALRRPRTRRGWLLTAGVVGAALIIKLTVSFGLVLLLLHHLLH